MTKSLSPQYLRELTSRTASRLLVIAGPCQIESLEHCRLIAGALRELTAKLPIELVFKSSFDKANRTSLKGQRGLGVEGGLEVLATIGREFDVPTITDIHLPEQAALAAGAVSILQIPAFLSRQTDLLAAAGETGLPVMIKKGQFLAPPDMGFAAEKVRAARQSPVLLCERGSCFGYRDLVVDMRGLVEMRALGLPVVFDATHSVQQMGSKGGSSGGAREFIAPLLRAAVAVGIDGIFFECHDRPETAPSDGATMLRLAEVPAILKQAVTLWETTNGLLRAN